MKLIKDLVLIAITLAALVHAQNGSSTGDDDWEELCNEPITNANASGVFPFSVKVAPAVTNDKIVIPDPAWAITVTDPDENRRANTSIWYDRAGQNYTDSTNLQYDVCTFFISRFPENTLALAQNDNGDCSAAFTGDCIQNLTRRAAAAASTYNSYTSPGMDLAANRLASICSYVAGNLGPSGLGYPNQCAQEFGIDAADSTHGVVSTFTELTSNSSRISHTNRSCTVSGQDGRTFDIQNRVLGQASNLDYDDAVRQLYAHLTVFFPHDPNGPYSSWANATLRCVRAKNISPGSRVPEKLAEGKWWKYPGDNQGLSKGAIAGIVVGVIVGLGVVVGGAVALWLRRRKRGPKAANDASAKLRKRGWPGKGDGANMLPEADDKAAINELNPEDRKPELASAEISELNAHEKPKEAEARERYELSTDGRNA